MRRSMRSLEKSLLFADRLSASAVVEKDISKLIALPQRSKDKDEVDGETHNNQEPGEEADNQAEELEEELVEENHQTAKEGEGKSIL